MENKYTYIQIVDGIIYLSIPSKTRISIEVAKEIVSQRHQLTKGLPYPGLCDVQKIGIVDKEAREYFCSEIAIKGVLASAFLVRSFFSMFIVNLFLRLNAYNVPFPVKVFSDEKAAIEWLQQYVIKK